MVLAEQDDEWLTMGKRYLPQGSMTRLLGGGPGTTLAEQLKKGMAVWEVLRREAESHHLTGHDRSASASTRTRQRSR